MKWLLGKGLLAMYEVYKFHTPPWQKWGIINDRFALSFLIIALSIILGSCIVLFEAISPAIYGYDLKKGFLIASYLVYMSIIRGVSFLWRYFTKARQHTWDFMLDCVQEAQAPRKRKRDTSRLKDTPLVYDEFYLEDPEIQDEAHI